MEEEYTITNNEFIKLFKSMYSLNVNSSVSLLQKFKDYYPIFDSEEIEYNENGYTLLNENFKSIIRVWQYDKISGKNNIKKIKVGNRKKYLFHTALRFLALREISFDHLIYLLCFEAYNYLEKCNEFSLKDVFEVAFDAYGTNLKGENHIYFAPNKKKLKVDKKWCFKNEVSAKSLSRKAQRLETDKKIAAFYDENLSVKENLKILHSNGVQICQARLYEYRDSLKNPQTNIIDDCKKINSKHKHKIENNAQTEKYFENEKNEVLKRA
ncbi:MAG TPA: hypothetical protein DD434_04585 [Bacteroidales bacterium]|nr:hypothetical protein [Bacteroidales bacterium]